jgi:hypothetical protein
LFVFAAKYMPQDLPDMFEEISRIEYSVRDSEDRVVLDVGKGAQLFNLAAAMSDEPDQRFDEPDQRFDEAYDPDATQASESQVRGYQERMGQPDPVELSMQESFGLSSQLAVVNGRGHDGSGSRETSTHPSGDEGEGPSSGQRLNPRDEGTSSGQQQQDVGTSSGQEQKDLRKRGQPTQQRGNSMHWCNVADDIPCDMDVGGCELTGACDNQVAKNNVEVLAAEWLCDDKERGQP